MNILSRLFLLPLLLLTLLTGAHAATLDIDNDGDVRALGDGLMLLRYLFGFTGDSVTQGAITPTATRSTAQIETYLDTQRAAFDVDGNGSVGALTDGLMVLRYLFGFQGTALTQGALGQGATRDAQGIGAYCRQLQIDDFDGNTVSPQIEAAVVHSLALRSDGTVWAWGDNQRGQLGDGTTTSRLTPVQIMGLPVITDVAAGVEHSVVVDEDGTVWTWGSNLRGQLGDGTMTSRTAPMAVAGLANVVAVDAGANHTVVLTDDGNLWAWGVNGFGQLGDGSTTDRSSSVPVSGLTNVVAVAAGDDHTVALTDDGTVWTWGSNVNGQLGTDAVDARSTPAQVSGLPAIVAVAAGESHTVVLTDNGTVWTWGWNVVGQLGDGNTADRAAPEPVDGLTGVTAVAAGDGHTVALLDDGSLRAWGWNEFGQLGDGTTTITRLTPTAVTGLTGVTTVTAGFAHTLALTGDGIIRAWGLNEDGQLGDGTTDNSTTAVQVNDLILAANGVPTLTPAGDSAVALARAVQRLDFGGALPALAGSTP